MKVLNVSRPMTAQVQLDLITEGTSVFVTANGQKALELTKEGYLRRLRGVSVTGLRQLPDGRLAIKPRTTR